MENELCSMQCKGTCTLRIDPIKTDHHPDLAKRKVEHGKAEATGREEQSLLIEEVDLSKEADSTLWTHEGGGVVQAVSPFRESICYIT
jgi:hypothetical protein